MFKQDSCCTRKKENDDKIKIEEESICQKSENFPIKKHKFMSTDIILISIDDIETEDSFEFDRGGYDKQE